MKLLVLGGTGRLGRQIVDVAIARGHTVTAMLFREMGLSAAIMRLILRPHARDLAAMEAVVTGSPLEWTLVRPPRLTDGPNSDYRAAAGTFPADGRPAMTLRAVATCMIDVLEKNQHIRDILGVAG